MNRYETIAALSAAVISNEILTLAVLLYFIGKGLVWFACKADAERGSYGQKYF